MNFKEEIGPREVVIPEQRFYSCYGCIYYDYHMVSSGTRPVYESICNKMNSIGEIIEDTTLGFRYELNDDGRTPDCCPYLKAVKRNDKIDKII